MFLLETQERFVAPQGLRLRRRRLEQDPANRETPDGQLLERQDAIDRGNDLVHVDQGRWQAFDLGTGQLVGAQKTPAIGRVATDRALG